MMTSTQKVIFSLALLAMLAVFSQARILNNNINDNDDDTTNLERNRRDVLQNQFQRLLDYLMAVFSSHFNQLPSSNLMKHMLQKPLAPAPPVGKTSWKVSPAGPQSQALQGSRSQVVVSSPVLCDPPCTQGSQCCLLTPGSFVPSCQSMRLAGNSCGWNHYTSSNPSTTVPLHNSTCPCLVGMACVSATASNSGVCTFF